MAGNDAVGESEVRPQGDALPGRARGTEGCIGRRRENIPKKFLDIILLELKNNGLLLSKKGKGGGYTLSRPAGRVMVGQIVRILDGPLAPIPCVSDTAYRPCTDCHDESACQIRWVMRQVRDATAEILDNTSLVDMASAGELPTVLYYEI